MMGRTLVITVFILLVSIQLRGQEFTAVEILKKSDAVFNAPKDQDLKIKLILIDSKDNEKEREFNLLQKGNEKRKIKFLSPADHKGIALLDLPRGKMYLYQPDSKKVRRIAGDAKNQKFVGSDFTYNDMAILNFADEYDPELMNKTGEHFILDLTLKFGVEIGYDKIEMWVRTDNYFPEKIIYFDQNNDLLKTLYRRKIEMEGKYWVSREVEMHNHQENHRTKNILDDVKFDTGLNDKLFTRRNLKK